MEFEYRRELAGGATLSTFTFTSDVLEDNALGDPARRSHPILLPAGGGAGLPLVVVLVGYTGFNHKVISKTSMWSETLPERFARCMANGSIPEAVYLWPSCETRLGGSQYMNSPGTGRYEDFLIDELVPAIESTHDCGGAGRRVVAGKSSGGYGALRLVMQRPRLLRRGRISLRRHGFRHEPLSRFRRRADLLGEARRTGCLPRSSPPV